MVRKNEMYIQSSACIIMSSPSCRLKNDSNFSANDMDKSRRPAIT